MKLPSLVMFAALCTALPAAAQDTSPLERSGTQGFGLGLAHTQNSFGGEGSGGLRAGLGLTAGYGVNEHLSLFARADVGYRVTRQDVGARYSFGGTASALRPYVELAGTRAATRFEAPTDGNAVATGFGVTAGAGVEYFVNRKLSLDLGITHSEGRFTSTEIQGLKVDGDRRLFGTRFEAGFRWHP